ncbi:myb-like protein X [Impatiens glandulifera]|uniref:myb-like protein X n=1 Tax=Impatiens glandulifera TaxID=253017 RepID=UPI001FB139EA|nr:myb-like protein X [Impatiens glandulifera]
MVQDVVRRLHKSHLLSNGEYVHMRCCAHILNLIVKDGLDVIKSSIEKVCDIVVYWLASPRRIEEFEDNARTLGIHMGEPPNETSFMDIDKDLNLDCDKDLDRYGLKEENKDEAKGLKEDEEKEEEVMEDEVKENEVMEDDDKENEDEVKEDEVKEDEVMEDDDKEMEDEVNEDEVKEDEDEDEEKEDEVMEDEVKVKEDEEKEKECEVKAKEDEVKEDEENVKEEQRLKKMRMKDMKNQRSRTRQIKSENKETTSNLFQFLNVFYKEK